MTVKFDIEIPLYSTKIKIIISDSLVDVCNEIKITHTKKRLYKLNNKELLTLSGIVIGQFFKSSGLFYCIIKLENNTINMDTLTHEIYHLTSKIMLLNGFNFYKDEEGFAKINGILNCNVIKHLKELGYQFSYEKNKNIKII